MGATKRSDYAALWGNTPGDLKPNPGCEVFAIVFHTVFQEIKVRFVSTECSESEAMLSHKFTQKRPMSKCKKSFIAWRSSEKPGTLPWRKNVIDWTHNQLTWLGRHSPQSAEPLTAINLNLISQSKENASCSP